MSEQSQFSERDRVATELRYVTRPYDWTAKPECLGAIVGWHLNSVATVRAETWILGSSEPMDPVSETALIRLQRYHFNRIVQRLKDENAILKLRLITACGCIEFYADGSTDAGARATAVLKALLADAPVASASSSGHLVL
jgi:hypothetical protein